MEPRELTPGSFSRYPEEAKKLATANISILREMPLALLPMVLHQLIRYDFSFPAERVQLVSQLNWLRQRDATSLSSVMAPFAEIGLSSVLRHTDWVNHPQLFSERLTAELWAQNKINQYHVAAQRYEQDLDQAFDPAVPSIPRLTMVVIGKDLHSAQKKVFRKLAPYGTLFTNLDPTMGLETLFAEVHSRAQQNPQPYDHWYIEGGNLEISYTGDSRVTVMSYARLVPAALREFSLMQQLTKNTLQGPVGAETVSSYIAGLRPEDLGLNGLPADAPLRHFEASVLTEGAGCQIFSTTFVQWASKECLRRAQPVTLIARYATRQALAPMEQLLSRNPLEQSQDAEGALVDADMGAYYTWIYQSRLKGAEQARFVAWLEGRNMAIAIAPTLPRGKTSTERCDLKKLLDWTR